MKLGTNILDMLLRVWFMDPGHVGCVLEKLHYLAEYVTLVLIILEVILGQNKPKGKILRREKFGEKEEK